MAERVRWTRRGYVAQLEKPEARLLRGLLRDVIALLENRQDEVQAAAEAAPASSAPAAEQDASAGAADEGTAPDGPAAGLRESDTAFWDLVAGLELSTDPRPHRSAPADAAVARLLPDALPQATAEERAAQRALTEDALTAAKLDDARRALAALQSTQVLLPHGEAVAFGRALNDVRLVLATRLGIETDEDAARVHAVDDWRRAEDLESTMALLYNFTTWFLETLMEEMLTELPLEGDAGADGGRA